MNAQTPQWNARFSSVIRPASTSKQHIEPGSAPVVLEQLAALVSPTVRLMLFLNQLDTLNFYFVCARTGLTADSLVATKCGNTARAIAHLLSMEPIQDITPEELCAECDVAYRVELRGQDMYGHPSSTDHALVLLPAHIVSPQVSGFLILDSYIGCRNFTISRCNTHVLREQLAQLKRSWDPVIWQAVTGCEPEPDTTAFITVAIHKCHISANHVLPVFRDLVVSAERLAHAMPRSYRLEHLALLAPHLHLPSAHNYLHQLKQLINT